MNNPAFLFLAKATTSVLLATSLWSGIAQPHAESKTQAQGEHQAVVKACPAPRLILRGIFITESRRVAVVETIADADSPQVRTLTLSPGSVFEDFRVDEISKEAIKFTKGGQECFLSIYSPAPAGVAPGTKNRPVLVSIGQGVAEIEQGEGKGGKTEPADDNSRPLDIVPFEGTIWTPFGRVRRQLTPNQTETGRKPSPKQASEGTGQY